MAHVREHVFNELHLQTELIAVCVSIIHVYHD